MPHSLLLFGHDIELLRIRRLVLKTDGYEVFMSASLDVVERLLKAGEVDILVLCHSLTEDQRRRALNQIASKLSIAKALVLVVGPQAHREALHANHDVQEGPVRLLAAVESLVREQIASSRSLSKSSSE